MQRLGPGPLTADHAEVWLDGGHNPSAARAIAGWVRASFTDAKPLHLIFASLGSKDPRRTLAPLAGLTAHVHTVPLAPGHDFREPHELAQIARGIGVSATAHGSVEEALAAIPRPARILIFGSLYLAGEILAANGEIPD
jgi:dihydrofolate synthase/folylpolyglutamate synthase